MFNLESYLHQNEKLATLLKRSIDFMFNLESYLHQWPLAGLDAEALSNTVTFCPTDRKGGGVALLVKMSDR